MPKPVKQQLSPYWTTRDGKFIRLYHGDVIDVLSQLPPKSVQMVVTSPPYWGLRDYGTGTWVGGNPKCIHEGKRVDSRRKPTVAIIGSDGNFARLLKRAAGNNSVQTRTCVKCSAFRIDNQIGSEKTPEEFIEKMVAVFRRVHRVLRDDGTIWLNMGDNYSNGGRLTGMPWRLALALQADGWILRQDIIWHKPSPMPESVRNRCTKAHEYIFLLAKSSKYFYDAEAIRTESDWQWKDVQGWREGIKDNSYDPVPYRNDSRQRTGANKRSVWAVASESYEGAHFATFPRKLIEPCILAGTSEKGRCPKCGAPWRRVVDKKQLTRPRPNDYVKRKGDDGTGNSCANSVAGVDVKTTGWEPTCSCGVKKTVPCVVLDPFVGSGTTCCVALANGRWSVGIDLSEQYLRECALPRIEGEILARPAYSRLLDLTPKQLF